MKSFPKKFVCYVNLCLVGLPISKKTKEERDFQHLQHILHFFLLVMESFVVA
jgi:hypothetical protein